MKFSLSVKFTSRMIIPSQDRLKHAETEFEAVQTILWASLGSYPQLEGLQNRQPLHSPKAALARHPAAIGHDGHVSFGHPLRRP